MDSGMLISSLARGLRVLNVLAEAEKPLTLTEISQLAEINRAAIQRYVYTFGTLGYIDKDEKKYRLGAKILTLGFQYLNKMSLQEKCFPYMKETAERIQKTINLNVLSGEDVIVIGRVEEKKILSREVLIGSKFPAYCTSGGKLLLAFLSEKDRNQIISGLKQERITSFTITSKDRLIQELTEIRRKGYAYTNQELSLDVRSVSAPVISSGNSVVAAVSIVVDASQFSFGELKDLYTSEVVWLGRQLSLGIGWQEI